MKSERLPWRWTESEARDAYEDYKLIPDEPLTYDEWIDKHRTLDILTDDNTLMSTLGSKRIAELSKELWV
jgi:hypothetical protein